MKRTLTAASVLTLLAAAPACGQDRPAPDLAGIEVDRDYIERVDQARTKGADDAPVNIVEVSDFQCGFCARFALETMPAIDSAYIQTGQVQFLYVHYPLPMHHQSFTASKASMCAGAQDEFWAMHDRIFETRDDWAGSSNPANHFEGLADELDLDRGEFDQCMRHDLVSSIIINDLLQISRTGIGGTPAFIINGERLLQGHQSFEEMSSHIEEMLANGAAGDEEDGEED